jgi:hypothetical protein
VPAEPTPAKAGSAEPTQAAPAEPESPAAEAAAAPAPPAPAEPVAAEAPAAPAESTASFTLTLGAPLVEYARRRLSRDGGATWRVTEVRGGLVAGPALRFFATLEPWLLLGGEFSGGFSTHDVDGIGETETDVELALEVSARLQPWRLAFGQPYLNVGVGGGYLDGSFVDPALASTRVQAVVPRFSGDLGAVLWLARDVVGLELGLGASYLFGPARFTSSEDASGFLQQLELSADAALLARF